MMDDRGVIDAYGRARFMRLVVDAVLILKEDRRLVGLDVLRRVLCVCVLVGGLRRDD